MFLGRGSAISRGRWPVRRGTTGVNETRAGSEGRIEMLWTIFVILLVLWALGLVTSYTMGGLIHVLLVLAIVAVAIQVLQGRKIFG